MAHNLYPEPPTAPLELSASGSADDDSGLLTFTPAGIPGTDDTIYIRIAVSHPDCSSAGVSAPEVWLRAGTGTPKSIPLDTTYVSIYNSLTELFPSFVGDAQMLSEEHDVFRIEIGPLVNVPVSWEIRIINTHTAKRHFVWVVADSNSEASQPWLDISSTTSPAGELNFNHPDGKTLLTRQSITQTLRVANKGTGPLTITDTAGAIGGSEFEIISVPIGSIFPNACGDLVIAFNAPATSGEISRIYNVGSSDTNALSDPATLHNRQVQLIACCGTLETVFVLDASGSMAYTPNGSGPASDVESSRWGKMKDAAGHFLDLLEFFAGGLGKIGIIIFPDITGPGYPETFSHPTSAVLQNATMIPADITPIKNVLDTYTPVAGHGWTPMGFGIETAMGATDTDFGLFEGSATSVAYNLRWMVVMSDGAHNQGPPDPLVFYGTDGTSFLGKKIRAVAVAYGDPGAIHWPPDHSQMHDLETESEGVYLDAGADDAGLGLFKSFRSAITSELALDPTIDPSETLTTVRPEFRREISILPYDTQVAFVVNWATFDKNRVSVKLITPNCELITPAEAAIDPNMKCYRHPRYTIYSIKHDYLNNAADPSNPRYGNWTLVIEGNNLDTEDSEPFDYEAITRSRLKMRLFSDKSRYYAGEPITLSARLTMDGKPIQNASVTVRVKAPGQAASTWLANQTITTKEYDAAAARLPSADVTPLAIKAQAVKFKALTFKSFIRPLTLTMTDPTGKGIYATTYDDTHVPGIYTFHLTAIGQTEDGVIFRREKLLHKYLHVQPVPERTFQHVVYRKTYDDNSNYMRFNVRVWPRDRFNNALLVDPMHRPVIELCAQNADPVGPLTSNLDGSYTRPFRAPLESEPSFSLKIKGKEILTNRLSVPVTRLLFADSVLEFKRGLTDPDNPEPPHRNPEDALGDVTEKDINCFVTLGVSGTLTVELKNRVISAAGPDDITIFVQPDETLHPYRVEALPVGPKDQWVVLGESPGVTQSFSLKQAGIRAAWAIRIGDRSRCWSSVESVINPGVAIVGVGIIKADKLANGCLWLPIKLLRNLYVLLGNRRR